MAAPDVLFIIFSTPLKPIPRPVASSRPERIIDDTHSILSCPYWCSWSDFLPDSFTPTITIRVLPTSDAECTASEIMAPECAAIPAINLKTERIRLSKMLIPDTFMAILFSSDIVCFASLFTVCSITRTSLIHIQVRVFPPKTEKDIPAEHTLSHRYVSDSLISAAASAARPHASFGIACSVCTVDLASSFECNAVQREFLYDF